MKLFKIISILTLMLTIFSCVEDVTSPELLENEVGLRNDTYNKVRWGIRFANSSRVIAKRSSDSMPYSDDGYYVTAIEVYPPRMDLMIIANPKPGQTIVYYKEGEKYKYKIE